MLVEVKQHRMLLKEGTGNGERGTGNRERVYSGNLHKNSKWQTKEKKTVWEPVFSRSEQTAWTVSVGVIEGFTSEC